MSAKRIGEFTETPQISRTNGRNPETQQISRTNRRSRPNSAADLGAGGLWVVHVQSTPWPMPGLPCFCHVLKRAVLRQYILINLLKSTSLWRSHSPWSYLCPTRQHTPTNCWAQQSACIESDHVGPDSACAVRFRGDIREVQLSARDLEGPPDTDHKSVSASTDASQWIHQQKHRCKWMDTLEMSSSQTPHKH